MLLERSQRGCIGQPHPTDLLPYPPAPQEATVEAIYGIELCGHLTHDGDSVLIRLLESGVCHRLSRHREYRDLPLAYPPDAGYTERIKMRGEDRVQTTQHAHHWPK